MSEKVPPQLLAVGYLARAHGLQGRVLVTPYNDGSEGLERATALWLSRASESAPPRKYAVAHGERVNLGYLFKLREIPDRNAAEALRGLEVRVSRDELPELQEGELFAADLLGLKVFDANAPEPREALGEVISLEKAGPNELLVLKLNSGEQVLAPIDFVREADLETKRLLLEIPQGLFEAQSAAAKPEVSDESPDDAGDADGAAAEPQA